MIAAGARVSGLVLGLLGCLVWGGSARGGIVDVIGSWDFDSAWPGPTSYNGSSMENRGFGGGWFPGSSALSTTMTYGAGSGNGSGGITLSNTNSAQSITRARLLLRDVNNPSGSSTRPYAFREAFEAEMAVQTGRFPFLQVDTFLPSSGGVNNEIFTSPWRTGSTPAGDAGAYATQLRFNSTLGVFEVIERPNGLASPVTTQISTGVVSPILDGWNTLKIQLDQDFRLRYYVNNIFVHESAGTYAGLSNGYNTAMGIGFNSLGSARFDNFLVAQAPEPSTLAMGGIGLAVALALGWRRRRGRAGG